MSLRTASVHVEVTHDLLKLETFFFLDFAKISCVTFLFV